MIENLVEVRAAAGRLGLDPRLVASLILVESGGNPYAWNPEPRYRYFWNVVKNKPYRPITAGEAISKFPPINFPTLAADPDQEWWAQQASWGLMQVMGAVARENGFKGPFLTELCNPVVNLKIGCFILSNLLKWSKDNVDQALAAYNGGKGGNSKPPYRNADYAKKVMLTYSTIDMGMRVARV